jgi:hypothetical protein
MIPSFDADGDLPSGIHDATWLEFRDRLCVFARSDRRVRLCQKIEWMVGEASATKIVERIIFGGSFVTAKAEPNDFDCVVVLSPKVEYESLTPAQRSIADTRQASRRYSGDIFVAKANQSTLIAYLTFLATNREGKQVGLIEVKL